MKLATRVRRHRALTMTEYLVLLSCVAIAAITLFALFGRQIKSGLHSSAVALGAQDTGGSSAEIGDSVPAGAVRATSVADSTSTFTSLPDSAGKDGAASGSGGPPGADEPSSSGGSHADGRTTPTEEPGWLARIDAAIRSALPPELAARFRGIENPNWQAGRKQALSDGSLLADVTPGVNLVKAVVELGSGQDPLTGAQRGIVESAVKVGLSTLDLGIFAGAIREGKLAVDVVEVAKGDAAATKVVVGDAADASGRATAPALYDVRFAAKQLLEEGRLSLDRLKSFVPEGTPNMFKPSSKIEFGQKYRFEINGSEIEVKFHSPDAGAAAKFPGSNSGSTWTAQIKVDGKLLGADGRFYSKPGNITHIPIRGLP